MYLRRQDTLGIFNHGDQNQVCVQTRWTNILVFFLANYVAHAATTVVLPGSSVRESTWNVANALLFPITGVNRGFRALFRLAIIHGAISGSDLQTAARAGAICKIVRTDDYAQTFREFNLSQGVKTATELSFWRKLIVGKVHGRVRLPEEYGLAVVPANSKFVNEKCPNAFISSSYSVVKVLVAVVQLIFSTLTLYRSVGSQIGRYGYAAFGLTVAQYSIMSFINLLAALVTPQYPTVYLVETRLMDSCRDHPDAVFEGVVGRLEENVCDDNRDKREPVLPEGGNIYSQLLVRISVRYWWLPIGLIPIAGSILIIWGLSRFQKASSTVTQRFILMLWLAVGNWVGMLYYDHPARRKYVPRRWYHRMFWVIVELVVVALVAWPAVWGFIIVGEMLMEFGTCIQLH